MEPKVVYLPNGDKVPLLKREGEAFRTGDLDVRSEIMIGLYSTGEKFRYRCPMCGKVEVLDQRMEPICTGPSWTNDHPYEMMQLVE